MGAPPSRLLLPPGLPGSCGRLAKSVGPQGVSDAPLPGHQAPLRAGDATARDEAPLLQGLLRGWQGPGRAGTQGTGQPSSGRGGRSAGPHGRAWVPGRGPEGWALL